MTHRISQASASEVADLLTLDREIFGDAAYDSQQWRSEFDVASSHVLIARNSKRPIGFISIVGSADEFEIRKLGIIAAERRGGIARQLIQQSTLQALTDSPGIKRCLIDVATDNAAAISFYLRLGFSEIARRRKYYTHGADAIIMEKILSVM